MNILEYKDAIIFDKRSYFKYYWSLIKIQHILFFAIIPSNDYNSQNIKLCILIFSLALYLSVKAFFFNESTMHKIYELHGSYNIIYQLPQLMYSSLISSIINIIIRYFSLTEKEVIEIKIKYIRKNISFKINKLMKFLFIKFALFFIISFIFLLFFWYYLSCFCAIYKNTQIYLIKDALICFGLSLTYPFIIYLIPAAFRIYTLLDKKKNRKCLYKFSKILQIL